MIKDKAYPFLKTLDLDQDEIRRLTLHLNRLELGNDEIFVTPIGADGKDKLILKEWDFLFNQNLKDINDVLLDMEIDNRSKFGPRSIALPYSQRKKNILRSFEREQITGSIDYKLPSSVINLRPLDNSTALKLLKNNTNSGLPFYTRKGKVKERTLKHFDELLKRKDPAILFTRTQEGNKTRNVWGYPIADTLNEMKYYKPILEHQKRQNYRAALIGPEKVSRCLIELVLKAQNGIRTILSIDFAHYDDSTKTTLQSLSFNYFKSLFQKKYWEGLDYIALRFRTIGLLTPDGIINDDHGTPSGSGFTNEVGSVSQITTGLSEPYVNIDDVQVQGDDGVYLVPKGKEDQLIRKFESFGLVVNKDKIHVSDKYAIYLQNLYHIDYINKGITGGIYSTYRALNRIVYQERWSDFEDYDIIGKDYYSIRTLCILENCRYHPLFRNLVEFVLLKDKYSLDFSSQGLSNYVHMLGKVEGAEGILNNQLGDNVKGLKSFASYKLIKELS